MMADPMAGQLAYDDIVTMTDEMLEATARGSRSSRLSTACDTQPLIMSGVRRERSEISDMGVRSERRGAVGREGRWRRGS